MCVNSIRNNILRYLNSDSATNVVRNDMKNILFQRLFPPYCLLLFILDDHSTQRDFSPKILGLDQWFRQ